MSDLQETRYRFKLFEIGDQEKVLLRDGVLVALPLKAVQTLLVLLASRGRVLSKSDLMAAVWPDSFVEEGSLTQNISVLRKAFAQDFVETSPIVTVPKSGYRFVADVEVVVPEPVKIVLAVPEANEPVVQLKPAVPGKASPASLQTTERGPRHVAVIAAALMLVTFAALLLLRSHRVMPPDGARTAVAVVPMVNLSGTADQAWLSSAIAENLSVELASNQQVRVVPTYLVEQTVRELALPASTALTVGQLSRIRKAVDCDIVLGGSYLVSGNSIRLNVSLQNAQTGQVIAVRTHSADSGQLLSLIDATGADLRAALRVPDLSMQSEQQMEAANEHNVDAWREYSQGLEKLRLEDGDGARVRLEKAIATDREFPLAHYAMAQAWFVSGYEAKASDESERAMALSAKLSREDRLRIEARAAEYKLNWRSAVQAYQALHTFYPDETEYVYLLADALIAAGNPKEALAVLDGTKGIQSVPRFSLLVARAKNAAGDWQGALSIAAAGAAAAKRAGGVHTYLYGLSQEAVALGNLGQTAREMQVLQEGSQLAASKGDQRANILFLQRSGNALRRAKRFGEARQEVEKGLELARQIDARQLEIQCLGSLGAIQRDANDLRGAQSTLQQALRLADEIGYKNTAILELNLANASNNLGYPSAARTLYEDALAKAVATGDIGTANVLNGNLGILDVAQGKLDSAMQRLQSAMDANRKISQMSSVAYELGHVARIRIEEADFASAQAALDEQAKILPALGHGRGPQEQIAMRSQLALARGHVQEARESLENALFLCRDDGECSNYNRQLAQAWLLLRDPRRAEAYALKASTLAHGMANPADYTLPADLQLAEVYAAEHDTKRARLLLRSVQQQSHELLLLPIELRANLQLAILEQTGRPAVLKKTLEAVRDRAVSQKIYLVQQIASQEIKHLRYEGGTPLTDSSQAH